MKGLGEDREKGRKWEGGGKVVVVVGVGGGYSCEPVPETRESGQSEMGMHSMSLSWQIRMPKACVECGLSH